ncbi:hypothetical protein SUGI_1200080 [Cryptomeria japonica]|uniref:uncharacterized protein LOC131038130 n=1 Tax=Cryptomeria japonica TaxID=3369 RepID=UPI002414AF0C|nr:uncharacterized protein LOC131038130 [Cryptomeria japonica]GLJ55897.1 hypothetical protein SUGI_1200080 [Cryptomeria japonica]
MASSFPSAGEYDADPVPPKVTATNSGCRSPLAGKDYQEGECCGDSGDLIRAEEVAWHSDFKRGESTSSNSGGQDDCANNSVPELVDSLETEWTDEKHSSFLDSIEASFVKKMYDRDYCSLDLCGQSPKEIEALDPDSAESRLDFPFPFNEFKIWQKGCWRTLPYADKSQHFSFLRVGGSTWIQHFRAPASKNQAVPASTVNESLRNGTVKRVVMLKHLGPTSAVMEKPPNASQGIHTWCHRLQSNHSCRPQSNYSGSAKGTDWNFKGDAITEMSQWNTSREADENLEDHPERESSPKKQKVNVHGVCKSPEDQVVPFLRSANAKEAGDCNYPSKIQGFHAYTNQQSNDSINFLSGKTKSRMSFLKHKQLSQNVGNFTKDDCSSKLMLNEGEGWESCKE